jgi:hypothetical protein
LCERARIAAEIVKEENQNLVIVEAVEELLQIASIAATLELKEGVAQRAGPGRLWTRCDPFDERHVCLIVQGGNLLLVSMLSIDPQV